MIERFENFTKNVAAASKCIAKIKAYEMRRFGLRGGCVMCLFFLAKNPDGLTPTELCELCGEDKAGVSRSLSILREKGYIEILDEGRIYRARHRITDAGKLVSDSVHDAIYRAVFGAGGELPDDEREIFYRTFATITKNLQALCDAL